MRFNGFSDEWESVTINNLSRIVTKQTGFDYTNTIKKTLKTERTKDSLPYIQTKNFHDRKIDYNTDYYIPLDIADKFPRIKLDEECILLSIVGASVGNIGFFDHKEDSFLSGAICVVKTKKYTYLNDIYHYMQSPYGQAQIKTTTKGAAQATITIDDIRNYIIKRSLNELERNKIVSFLNLIDERIYTQNKIICDLKILMKRTIDSFLSKTKKYRNVRLSDLLVERHEKNSLLFPVYSVAVKDGIVNQEEHLGRSFAAKDTSNYNVVAYGDIVYTKSPTGLFPYGIVKQSFVCDSVSVSPLYGVYRPKSIVDGNYIHYYFLNEVNTNNYLHPLVNKGAKNTMNITNSRFLEGLIRYPENGSNSLVVFLNNIRKKLEINEQLLNCYLNQKKYLLHNLFI